MTQGKAPPGSDRQKLWFDSYVRVAWSKEAVARLKQLLQGRLSLAGLDLDPDRRWDLIAQLCRHGARGAQKLIESERLRDPSRQGQTAAIRVEALRPEKKLKNKWLEAIVAQDSRKPLAELRAAMRHIFPFDQHSWRRSFAKQFYAHLSSLARTQHDEFLEEYAENLVPMTCQEAPIQVLGQYLQANPDLPAVVLKELRVARQEAQRCLMIRKAALGTGGRTTAR